MDLSTRISKANAQFNDLCANARQVETQLLTAQQQMDRIVLEQGVIERAAVALTMAKPLLSASTIKQAESLANSAISSIFRQPWTVSYDVESSRFVLNKDGYDTDLADSQGGGLVTVVSTVFSIYLLMKLGKRRFMALDEAWTQVSSEYFPRFMAFIKKMCADLHLDILLISHDVRISDEMVDHIYEISDGVSKKLK